MAKSTKMVTIKLPVLMGETQEDEAVWVNNKRYVVKRGVPVDVPESVAAILLAKENQELAAYERMTKLQNKNKKQ